MARQPTIKDVAKAARVSTATVSRVLQQTDHVRPETRDRVLRAVNKVKYNPNVIARHLRTQETRTVFLVVRNIRNPFYLDVFRGVEAEARALNYNVLMGNTEDDLGREREYFEMLKARHADGMILMTGKLPLDIREGLGEDGPPVVVSLEYFPGLDLPSIRIDNIEAAEIAVKHLIELGHKRIAHITGPTPEAMSIDRHQGYLKAMNDAGLHPNENMTVRGDYSIESGHAACRALFSQSNPPTAIFCSNDEMAMGAINELRTLNLSVPEDVSVVGFDDIVFAGAFHPPLTTIRQPRQEIGRTSMRLLSDLLAGRPIPNQPVIIPTELMIRQSTAPPSPGGRSTNKE